MIISLKLTINFTTDVLVKRATTLHFINSWIRIKVQKTGNKKEVQCLAGEAVKIAKDSYSY